VKYPEEVWLAVPGYEGTYEASSLGGIRSIDRVTPYSCSNGRSGVQRRKGKMLAPHRKGKYLFVTLVNGPDRADVTVHAVIAATFIGPRPAGLMVCHNDGDGTRNVPSNIRYDTPASNSADMVRHGNSGVGEKNAAAKLSSSDVLWIRANRPMRTLASMAEKFGVSIAAIHDAAVGNTWPHLESAA
jgi:hypothetical protein